MTLSCLATGGLTVHLLTSKLIQRGENSQSFVSFFYLSTHTYLLYYMAVKENIKFKAPTANPYNKQNSCRGCSLPFGHSYNTRPFSQAETSMQTCSQKKQRQQRLGLLSQLCKKLSRIDRRKNQLLLLTPCQEISAEFAWRQQ